MYGLGGSSKQTRLQSCSQHRCLLALIGPAPTRLPTHTSMHVLLVYPTAVLSRMPGLCDCSKRHIQEICEDINAFGLKSLKSKNIVINSHLELRCWRQHFLTLYINQHFNRCQFADVEISSIWASLLSLQGKQ